MNIYGQPISNQFSFKSKTEKGSDKKSVENKKLFQLGN